MPKILKLQTLWKVFMALSICWTYLSDVPIDDQKRKILHKPFYIGTSVDNRISFQNHFIFFEC